MLVKLLILHEVRMRLIILSSVVFWKYYNFYALCPKRHDFLKQKRAVMNMKCMYWFPAQILSAKFPILSRFERDIIHVKGKVIPLQARCGPEGG